MVSTLVEESIIRQAKRVGVLWVLRLWVLRHGAKGLLPGYPLKYRTGELEGPITRRPREFGKPSPRIM